MDELAASIINVVLGLTLANVYALLLAVFKAGAVAVWAVMVELTTSTTVKVDPVGVKAAKL